MLDRLVSALRAEVSGERALASVRDIARFHRVQASPGLDEAADWLASEIERAGLLAELERVAADGRTRFLGHLMPQGWACERATAALHGDGAPRTLADDGSSKLSVILRSAPARGRFGLVDVGEGTEFRHYEGLRVQGRVVLTRGDVHRVHRLAVVERGAAGLLSWGRRLLPPVREEETDLDALAYTSFWWGEKEPRGWGFVISPREGRALGERLRTGARLELEVRIESRAFDTTIPLVSALTPLTRSHSSEGGEIIVVSHLCHPQPSANDNASGAAANLEAARALMAVASELPPPISSRRVRHLWLPEFTGTFAWHALRERSPQAAPALAALNLDMVGEDQAQCGSTFLLEHPPCFSASFAETLLRIVRERCSDWVLSFSGPGHVPIIRVAEVPYSGGSDHTVFIDPALGVPCPMLVQWPDRFYHSSLDTPDRCDPRSLALAARTAAAYAAFLARAGMAECEWLARRIARRSRERLLHALDHEEAPRLAQAERLRAQQALASLVRLAPSPGRAALEAVLARERSGLDRFWSSEIASALEGLAAPPAPAASAAASGGMPPGASHRIPVRRVLAPLHYQRWLLPGWDDLPEATRERWRAVESGEHGHLLDFELAWSVADGGRTVSDIADQVWLETGHRAHAAIAEFFEWSAALGLSQWRAGEES